MSDLMNVREAAEMLSLSKPGVYKLIKTGELPAVRLGQRSIRLQHSDVLDYIRARRTRASAEQDGQERTELCAGQVPLPVFQDDQ